MNKHKPTDDHLIGCLECKNKVSFELPQPIINACLEGKLVVFAGAGISTEGKNIFPFTLYDDIRGELNIKNDILFPTLMTKFVNRTHDKRLLLQKIKQRIDYARSFPDLYQRVVRFHRELSTIHQIREIITTNWDDFFEKECGATPIVVDEDFAFWDEPYRKVFKIHGSINNPGSIVATEEDYKNCYKKLSKTAVGGSLRHLLATKTIVFCGYSLRDQDFKRIYEYLKKSMGDFMPHSYIVTLSEKINGRTTRTAPTIVRTDATYFLSKLKEELVKRGQLIPDSVYSEVILKLLKMREIHFGLAEADIKKDPFMILCLSYQDGILHALERMVENWHSGYYSHLCRVEETIESYFKLRGAFLRKKKYFDVAYIDGYLIGLFQIVPDMRKVGFPTYYVFGSEPLFNHQSYRKVSKRAKKNIEAVYRWAKKQVGRYKFGTVLQHTPFLMGVGIDEI
jgi:NAD-dependent SIR2 family protein deacetylase